MMMTIVMAKTTTVVVAAAVVVAMMAGVCIAVVAVVRTKRSVDMASSHCQCCIDPAKTTAVSGMASLRKSPVEVSSLVGSARSAAVVVAVADSSGDIPSVSRIGHLPAGTAAVAGGCTPAKSAVEFRTRPSFPPEAS